MGGVLLFLGLSFLHEWLYEIWFKLPRIDCVAIVFILAVIGIFGFLEGVGVGLLIALVIFVVRYSRVSVVKRAFSGVDYYSSVDRSPSERRLFAQRGESLYILQLHGFIFFGTANNLLDDIRKRANDEALQPIRYILIDFRLVSGVDSSAANSFTRMKHYAEAQGYTLIFTHLAPALMNQFKRRGFEVKDDEHFRMFADLDRGVEWCENHILMDEHIALDGQRPGLEDQLRNFLPSEAEVESIMKYMERREEPEGYTLICQGDPPHSLYFLESGQITAQLENKGETVRLRTMRPGTVVGELGLYLKLPSTASVITDRPSVFYRLTAEALEKLEKNEPKVASAFHRFIIHCLGERLMHTNESLRSLMD